MRYIASIFHYISGPALLGLLAAILVVLAFPERFTRLTSKQTNQQMNTPRPEQGPVSYANAVNKAAASVVNIYTLKEQLPRSRRFNPFLRRFENNPGRTTPNTGSGVIVSDEGYIVTTLHLLESVSDIRVVLLDGRETIPLLVGYSIEHDMAVLQIDLDNIQAIEIGDLDRAQVGDVVLAIGNPFGVGQTVTQGIISGTRRKGLNIATYENYLQTDAAINPGNSGGALVNAEGRLLGINIGDLQKTNLGYANGIGFAIPADRVIQKVQDIIEYGRVVGGWLGIEGHDLNPASIAEFNLNIRHGILITGIQKNGPADIAGLLAGDIITAFNGNTIDSVETASQEFGDLRPGDVLTIDIVRDGEERKLDAVVGAAPEV